MGPVEASQLIDELSRVPFYYMAGSTQNKIAFISTEGGQLALWAADPRSGSKAKISTGAVYRVAEPRHNTDLIYFTRDSASGAEQHNVHVADAVRGGESMAVEVPSTRIEGIATSGDLIAFTGATKEEMALYTAESGRIDKKARFATFGELSDASSEYLVGFGTLAKNPRSSEIFIYKIGKGEYSEYTPKAGSVNKAARIRGTKILFESNFEGKNILYLYDIEEGVVIRAPLSFSGQAEYDPVEHPYYGWTDEGKVWAIGKKNGQAKAFVDGKEIPTPLGFLWGMTVLGGKVYTSQTTVTQPMRILEIDLEGGDGRVFVDNPLPSNIREVKRRSRTVWYESFDGRRVQAFVIDDGQDRPRKTVVYVHGGPWSDIIDTWGVFMNTFNLSGYNVIAPNYRGSTGYGEEFRLLDIGDPGGGDLQDVVWATQWAKANGVATECAIAGYSYGGYTTLLGIGKEPDVWECGVAGAPIADWKEMREMSDAAYREFVDTLFDYKGELLDERSPKTYASRVKKPLCITVSQNDSRTPLRPVMEYALALTNSGAKFEIHSTAGTGHAITSTSEFMSDLLPAVTFLHKHFSP